MSKTLLGPLFRRLRDQSEPSAASRFEYRYEYDRDHDSGLAEESPPQRTRPPPAARPLAPLPPSLPAYSPATHNQAEESRWRNPSGKRGHISSLPLGLLYSILALTLDPAATPNRRAYLDPENEPLLRTAELFRLRAVDRRFFLGKLISTAACVSSHTQPRRRSCVIACDRRTPHSFSAGPVLTRTLPEVMAPTPRRTACTPRGHARPPCLTASLRFESARTSGAQRARCVRIPASSTLSSRCFR